VQAFPNHHLVLCNSYLIQEREHCMQQKCRQRECLCHRSCGWHRSVSMDDLASQHRARLDICRQLWWKLQHCRKIHHLCNTEATNRIQVDKNTLKFVKIDQSGIDFTTQVWASEVLIENNSTWTITVPKSLAPGKTSNCSFTNSDD